MTKKVNFAQAIAIGFKKYARFKGVASRSEFWYFVLFYFLVNLVLSTIDSVIAMTVEMPVRLADLSIFVFFLPLLTVTARRFKDTGFSAWLIWLQAIPAIALIALAIIAINDPAVQQLFVWAMSNYSPTTAEIEQIVMAMNPNIGWAFVATVITSLAWSVFQLVVTLLPTKSRAQGNRFAPEEPVDYSGTGA